ncbi:hypothetical protein K2Q16_00890 [Patescibacteria group bacterium]|nr:hypothetical protein [Patescibacteria group bacterium]
MIGQTSHLLLSSGDEPGPMGSQIFLNAFGTKFSNSMGTTAMTFTHERQGLDLALCARGAAISRMKKAANRHTDDRSVSHLRLDTLETSPSHFYGRAGPENEKRHSAGASVRMVTDPERDIPPGVRLEHRKGGGFGSPDYTHLYISSQERFQTSP